MSVKICVGLTGRFLLEAVNADTGEKRFLAEFDNLITNGGLNKLGNGAIGNPVISHVQVGFGSTLPAETNSSLANFLVGTDRGFSHSSSYGPAPTYHTEKTFSWQFDQGVAAGNLSEIGVGWAADGSLFSRALILDGSGNPTTITIQPIEFLTVTYKLRMYPPVSDVTGVINISGVNYNYTIRASDVASQSWQNHGVQSYWTGQYSSTLYTGSIGAITGYPSGTSAGITVTPVAYVNDSFKRVVNFSAGITQGNLVGGVGAMTMSTSDHTGFQQMKWQCGFVPSIPKDNTKTLSLTFEFAWARKP